MSGHRGGAAPEYLRLNLSVLECVRHSPRPATTGRHLPRCQILAAARVIEVGACPLTGVRPEVELAGANYADIAIDAAVTDGNLVTAPAWPAASRVDAAVPATAGTRIIL